jgi:hypothetical protein
LLLRLRCYLPSTSATLLILAVAFIALHGAASHTFAGLSLATEIVIGLGLAGLAAGTIVISAVTIQRRRAAAGACHACSHPCRGAMVPSPEIDTRRWPHRPLYLPGGQLPGTGGSRPPFPLAPVPPAVRAGGADRKNRDHIGPASPNGNPAVTRLPLTVISARRDTAPAWSGARERERLRG